MFKTGDTAASKNWSPALDAGRHHRARLGFILMSTDLAAEVDFFDMVPPGVAVRITRLKTEDYTTNETLARHIGHMADAAARIQPDLKPDEISSNQAQSWSCLRPAGITDEITGFGRIFQNPGTDLLPTSQNPATAGA